MGMYVSVELHNPLKLGNKGVSLRVFEGDKQLGRLLVGKATVKWFPKNAHKAIGEIRLTDLIAQLEKKK